jgi:hypothetical protein
VCEVVVPELVVPELVVPELVVDEPAEPVVVVAPVALVLAAATAVGVVVAPWPSCQAITPPRESIAATLSAAAVLRAFAARGLRRRGWRAGTRRGGGAAAGVGVCSSMSNTLRIGHEGVARTG